MSNNLKIVKRSMLRSLTGRSNGSAGIDFVRTLALGILQPVQTQLVLNETSIAVLSLSVLSDDCDTC